ncbi:MAG: D-tyrosyl-tRNA(Tyr) deacylase [Chloroflexi bacterium]|nr:D-tyrosyl-tRNA(Tyr) deacylase [Chloroflexota bacterium]
MKAILQRVQRGSVSVGGNLIAEIKGGLVILLGVGPDDTQSEADKLVQKISQMRIFPDETGKMNLSLLDISGEALVVPQFTLFADTRRGHRPSFTDAGPPAIAKPLTIYFASSLRELGIPTAEGEFGAHMLVEIINDGPVTILVEV